MEALFLLVPLSLLAVGVAVLAFFRMNAGGQFDDAEGPAWSVLMDDDRVPASDAADRPSGARAVGGGAAPTGNGSTPLTSDGIVDGSLDRDQVARCRRVRHSPHDATPNHGETDDR